MRKRVLVFGSTLERAIKFLDTFDIKQEDIVRRSKERMETNDTIYVAASIQTSARGNRCHDLYIDKQIVEMENGEELIHCVAYPCLVRYGVADIGDERNVYFFG